MHLRGRSRNVSPVALARLASEERRQPSDMPPHNQQCHHSQRAQRLRACEQLWELEKTRLSDEKRRRREHDADQERVRLTEKHRPITSRLEPPPPSRRDQDPFQYAFMPPSVPRSPKSSKKTVANAHHRTVSFKEVVNAMNGKLFPLDPAERTDDARRIAGLPIPTTSPHKRIASVRADLLDNLLQAVDWHQSERRHAKGKDVDRVQCSSNSSIPAPSSLSVPSSLSAASLSSATPFRSSSWLSFGSWRSTATDITTPDSPVSPSPSSQPCILPTLIDSHRDFHPRAAFIRTSLEDSPLCPPLFSTLTPDHDDPSITPSTSTDIFSSLGIRGTLVKRVTRSVATIVEAAKGLQSAYISATMFAAGNPYQGTDRPPQHHRPPRCQQGQVRPEGYRALAKDVRKFIDATTPISQTSEPVHFIPLVSPPSGNAGIANPPLPKNVVIFPSPLRPRTPPATLAYRMRPVANPAVLRLKALQNLMFARGKEWEGRAREGGLGCGKERVLGIAFEGRGRSGLGCEVRFVVA